MTDFLTNILDRFNHRRETLRTRPIGLFEPQTKIDLPVLIADENLAKDIHQHAGELGPDIGEEFGGIFIGGYRRMAEDITFESEFVGSFGNDDGGGFEKRPEIDFGEIEHFGIDPIEVSPLASVYFRGHGDAHGEDISTGIEGGIFVFDDVGGEGPAILANGHESGKFETDPKLDGLPESGRLFDQN